MIDRGFIIEDLVIPHDVKLNIPPFLGVQPQTERSEVVQTQQLQIASLCIHIDQVICRVKEFDMLLVSSDACFSCCFSKPDLDSMLSTGSFSKPINLLLSIK